MFTVVSLPHTTLHHCCSVEIPLLAISWLRWDKDWGVIFENNNNIEQHWFWASVLDHSESSHVSVFPFIRFQPIKMSNRPMFPHVSLIQWIQNLALIELKYQSGGKFLIIIQTETGLVGCAGHISCLMCRVTVTAAANKWNILADRTHI